MARPVGSNASYWLDHVLKEDKGCAHELPATNNKHLLFMEFIYIHARCAL